MYFWVYIPSMVGSKRKQSHIIKLEQDNIMKPISLKNYGGQDVGLRCTVLRGVVGSEPNLIQFLLRKRS